MDMDDNSGMAADDMGGMDMDMSMVMTFTSWSDYQLKIVWDGWDVQTQWQFALSWFAVMLMTVGYQGLKYQYTALEAYIMSLRLKRNDSGDDKSASPSDKSAMDLGASAPVSSRQSIYEKLMDNVVGGASEVPFKYIIVHAVLGTLNYAVALILMLVAMTYNPNLFMALVVGYFFGDLFFFRRPLMPKLAQYEAVNARYGAADGDCH